jgi:hypothetical protein
MIGKWMTRTLGFAALLILLFCAMGSVPVQASVTPQISYQAKLLTDGGAPVADGSYSMIISLYGAPSGGTPIWTARGTTGSPSALTVSVTNGLFSVSLGDTSIAGGLQNALTGIDWNTSSLYLGVTVGSDSEMTPRRQLNAVPQALLSENTNQLQGMSASSTAFGDATLFTIHQTSATSATGTRSALDVRSEGTNDSLDYLFRGINNAAATVFSLNRQGAVTTTGRVYFDGTGATSTILGNLTVGTSTRDTLMPSGFAMDGDDLLVGGAIGSASSVYTNAGIIIGASGPRMTSSQLSFSGSYVVTSSAPLLIYGNNGASAVEMGESLRLKGGLTLSLDGGTSGVVSPGLGDRGASLGSALLGRFDAYLGYVTSTREVVVDSDTTTSTFQAVNNGSSFSGTAWGAYTNRLLVGDDTAATGTKDYVGLISYNSAANHFGLCLNNKANGATCPWTVSTSTVYSILADDAIGADAFDLAERYQVTGSVVPGDVLVMDADHPMHLKKSTGIAYDPLVAGVVSTRPGFVLGSVDGTAVALVGRVPTKVSVRNGTIQVGDLLTSSDEPGVAMKATRPGRILGRALENASADGEIEVFLQPGYDATALLHADGSMTRVTGDLMVASRSTASPENPAVSSYALSFQGAVWDGARSLNHAFSLENNPSTTSSRFELRYDAASSSIFSIDQLGNASFSGDVALSGRLFPSSRGVAQTENYIFLDTSTPGTSYMATNASGWQADDAYDYAERYYSPDRLEPGDLVTVNQLGHVYVQRSLDDRRMLVGIVSTQPGFITGQAAPSTYPIALAGRVPTKVSTMNGAIEPGDPLAPSTIPGVAVKATKAGPIVGLALEAYADSEVGKIEVFVHPTWWGGSEERTNSASVPATVAGPSQKQARGFAEIQAGEKRVKVTFPSVLTYPHVQVTPYAQTEGGWWIEHVTEAQFEIVLGQMAARDTRFSWTVEAAGEEEKLFHSNGSALKIDLITGAILDESSIIRTPFTVPAVEHSPSPESDTQTNISAGAASTTQDTTTPTSTQELSSTGEQASSTAIETTSSTTQTEAVPTVDHASTSSVEGAPVSPAPSPEPVVPSIENSAPTTPTAPVASETTPSQPTE